VAGARGGARHQQVLHRVADVQRSGRAERPERAGQRLRAGLCEGARLVLQERRAPQVKLGAQGAAHCVLKRGAAAAGDHGRPAPRRAADRAHGRDVDEQGVVLYHALAAAWPAPEGPRARRPAVKDTVELGSDPAGGPRVAQRRGGRGDVCHPGQARLDAGDPRRPERVAGLGGQPARVAPRGLRGGGAERRGARQVDLVVEPAGRLEALDERGVDVQARRYPELAEQAGHRQGDRPVVGGRDAHQDAVAVKDRGVGPAYKAGGRGAQLGWQVSRRLRAAVAPPSRP